MWNLPSVPSRFQNVDLVIVRENTEDLYAGLEHVVVPGVVESLKIITEEASTKIARFAFDYARRHKRKRVTAVHKANIMKLSDGLFLECARRTARDYPEIQYDERIVDAACMHLVMHPEKLDVLLLPNLYGDIVSDLCAGLVGGLGVVPAANLGDGGVGVFEAVHGTAPDIAGQNKANPTALLLSAVLMLHHLHEDAKAETHHEGAVGRARGRIGAHQRPRRHRDDNAVHRRHRQKPLARFPTIVLHEGSTRGFSTGFDAQTLVPEPPSRTSVPEPPCYIPPR